MSGHSTRWLFQSTHSSWNTEIWNVGFCRGRESRRPREKTLGVRTRTKTNSTHIGHQVLESNLGHSDGR